MNKKANFIYLIGILLVVICSCNKPKSDSENVTSYHLAVVPEVKFDKDRVYGNSLIHVTYTWKTLENFQSITQPVIVKVHFVDSDGVIFWQDDHALTPPINGWQPGENYTYERIVYVPMIPRITQISILLGLYEPDAKSLYFLQATPVKKDWYNLGKITVSPPRSPDNLPGAKIEHLKGWYEMERNVVTKSSWIWMSDHSEMSLKNPGRDAELFMRGWIPTSVFQEPATITLKFDGKEFRTYSNVTDTFEIYEKIPVSLFEDKESMILEIDTDHSYVPAEIGASSDSRKLGLMFKNIYFN